MSPAPATGEIWSVTELTQRIQVVFTKNFSPLWIEGEISNYTKSAAGHRYFSLKDDRNQVRAALFKNYARSLKFDPRDGQKVLVFGTVQAYGARSEYQIIVQQIMPVGVGELELAFKQLHARLEKEGLFDPARKRPLPEFPRRIGIVTSAQGAAVRDILKVLRRRAPHVQAVIAPVLVQGEKAAAEISAAISLFNKTQNVDLLIVGRGGGSLEDLWAFNEEPTVRAVAASEIPVISAVGHEVDTTLCDLAADHRAPTPSAAAEIAVADRRELLSDLRDLTRRFASDTQLLIDDNRRQVAQLTRRYGFRKPQDLLNTLTQTADALTARLVRAKSTMLGEHRQRLTALSEHPSLRSPRRWLLPRSERWQTAAAQLDRGWARQHRNLAQRLDAVSGRLDALSPQAVLDRGYAIVMDPEGRVVRSIEAAESGKSLTTWLSDGKLRVRVEDKEAGKAWP